MVEVDEELATAGVEMRARAAEVAQTTLVLGQIHASVPVGVRRLRWRALGVAVSVAAACAVVVVVRSGADQSITTAGTDPAAAAASSNDSAVDLTTTLAASPTTPTETASTPAPATTLRGQTSRLDESPDLGVITALPAAPISGRSSPESVWTGSEFIVWGGDLPADGVADDPQGAAYDPNTHTWRVLPPAPIVSRADAATVWTGTEMIIWGGETTSSAFADGAAYNPVTNAWRVLAAGPLAARAFSGVVWTGDRMIIVSGHPSEVSLSPGQPNPALQGASYDPAADRWTRIADAPGEIHGPDPQMVWTGTDVLAVLGPDMLLGPSSPGALPSMLATYSPSTNTWTTAHSPTQPAPSELTLISPPGPDALVAAIDPVPGVPSYILDAHGNVQRTLAPRPLDPFYQAFSDPVWDGTELISWLGNPHGLALNPATDTWRIYNAGSLPPQIGSAMAWTGTELLTWGGSMYDANSNLVGAAAGISYRPDTTGNQRPPASTVTNPPLGQVGAALPKIAAATEDVQHHVVLDLSGGLTVETRGLFNDVPSLCVISAVSRTETGRVCADNPSAIGLFDFPIADPADASAAYEIIATASTTMLTAATPCKSATGSTDGSDVTLWACHVSASPNDPLIGPLRITVSSPGTTPVDIAMRIPIPAR
ncbi:MAG: hypothetical protein JWN62_4712 [Acidimicrobiales bacterium]|nr:hypothetical protein [Acidimicrobiales bacterium]